MASCPSNDNQGESCNELRMVILGKTGSGKSATGNTILGQECFQSKLWGSSITETCTLEKAKRFGKDIVLVDTPGLFDTRMSEAEIWNETRKCIALTTPGPHAILLVMTPGRVTEEEKKTVEYFENILGNGMCKYLIVVFTRRDELERHGLTIDGYLENCPDTVKNILQKCDKQYINVDNCTKEKLDYEAKKLISMVQDITEKNGASYYTCEMYEEAEKHYLKREKEKQILKNRKKEEEIKKMKLECKKEVEQVCANMKRQMVDLQKQAEETKKREENFQKEEDRQKIKTKLEEIEVQIRRLKEAHEREIEQRYEKLIRNRIEEIERKFEAEFKNIRDEIRREYEQNIGIFQWIGSKIDARLKMLKF